MMPFSVIEAASSSRSVSSKCLRGLRGLGRRNSIGTRFCPRGALDRAGFFAGVADQGGQAAPEARPRFLCHSVPLDDSRDAAIVQAARRRRSRWMTSEASFR